MKKPKVLMVFMPRTILHKISKTMGNELLVVEGLNRGAILLKSGMLPNPIKDKKTKTMKICDLDKTVIVTVPSNFEKVNNGMVQEGDLLYDRIKGVMVAACPFSIGKPVSHKTCVIRKKARGKA